MPVKEGPLNADKMPTWTVAWFKIASKKGWKTKNIAFEQHKRRGQRETDDLDIRAFRLRIEDSDLTKVLQDSRTCVFVRARACSCGCGRPRLYHLL